MTGRADRNEALRYAREGDKGCSDDPDWIAIENLRRCYLELDALINNPQVDDFLAAVRLEAAHQVERWGTEHDEGKDPTDWFWLLGYLSGKAVWAAVHGDREKALHHVITTAAACLNWHAQLAGMGRGMQPGHADSERLADG